MTLKESDEEDDSIKACWMDYRKMLIECEQKSQEQYDKAVIVLSGGALAISIAFVKDIIGEHTPVYTIFLAFAWGAWGVSLACVLFSFWFSSVALRKTIVQVDARRPHQSITSPGDGWTSILKWLNFAGGALFVAGAAFLFVFAYHNLNAGDGDSRVGNQKQSVTTDLKKKTVMPQNPSIPVQKPGQVTPPPPTK
jgi:hypothetical protein